MAKLNRATTHLAGNTMDTVSTAAELRALLGEYRTAQYRGLVRASDAAKQDARKRAAGLSADIAKASAAYGKLVSTPQERKLFAEFTAAWAKSKASYESVNEMIDGTARRRAGHVPGRDLHPAHRDHRHRHRPDQGSRP
ncbi:MCP four helix bundle domain-containing protein [Pseudoxanthomonas sp. NC8]|nr:MCP four helix bundle domain-containing protein [Pseudoxanthomonas sp. NC8]